MLFEPRQPPFLSVRASFRTGCKRTFASSLRLYSWTHWTSASELSCLGSYWKSTTNSIQTLRRLMSWKLPCIWQELPQEHTTRR